MAIGNPEAIRLSPSLLLQRLDTGHKPPLHGKRRNHAGRKPSLHHKCREVAGVLGRVGGGEVSADILARQPAVGDKRGAGQFSATLKRLDKFGKLATRLHEDFRPRQVEHPVDVIGTCGGRYHMQGLVHLGKSLT